MRRLIPFVIALLVATPLAAQSVRGRIAGTDGAPISGAIVSLADSAGTQRGRILSTALGGYLLRIPGPGRYTLVVLRIGYPAFRSPPFEVRGVEVVDLSISLPDDPIVLEELSVEAGGSSCRADEALAGPTATLLGEVQKAIGSAELALADRGLRFEVMYRVLREGLHVEHYSDSSAQVLHTWPVHSLPAQLLSDRGFVQSSDSVDASLVPPGAAGKIWFGPDPATLFAPPFLASHCYRIKEERGDGGRIGLSFAPVPGRHRPDIKGTLWLDRRTFRLQRIEYEYVGIARHLTRGVGERPRGTMDLLRLPTGLWVVSKWSLRVPIERTRNDLPFGVAGWLEQGGEIRHIRTTQGAVIY